MWRCSSGVQDENYKSENGRGVSSLTADSTATPAAPPAAGSPLFIKVAPVSPSVC